MTTRVKLQPLPQSKRKQPQTEQLAPEIKDINTIINTIIEQIIDTLKNEKYDENRKSIIEEN